MRGRLSDRRAMSASVAQGFADGRARERQTLGHVCRTFTGRVYRLENSHGSFLDSVRRSDRRRGQNRQMHQTLMEMTVEIRSSRTRGAIMCDRHGHSVCRWCDRRVCRPRRVPNGSFRRGTSIYMCWPALGLNTWHFEILVSILS
jgi:hypothetical protein